MVKLTHEQYKIAWVSALPLELAAARLMLDEEHEDLLADDYDYNQYCFGKFGQHNVVLACLPSTRTGTNSAASVATHMLRTFPSIKIALMVGIGGGIPKPDKDIRLGDVVISKPTGIYGGLVQHDFGRVLDGCCFESSQWLNRPDPVVLSALSVMESEQIMGQLDLRKYMPLSANVPSSFHKPRKDPDRLFVANYSHNQSSPSCDDCDQSRLVARPDRRSNEPPIQIHYGNILSSNSVMRDAVERDRLGERYEAICFETEASGLWELCACITVRGVCNYADTHHMESWNYYAALTAAAGAKAFLSMVDPTAEDIVDYVPHEDIKGVRLSRLAPLNGI